MNLAAIQRSWKIPANATHEVFEEANAIAFFCPDGEAVQVRVFTGRAQRARTRFTARSVEAAHNTLETRIVPRLVDERARRSMSAKAVAAKRAACVHAHQLGDILYTSWGYEQTNISFFEVTRVVSAQCIEVRLRNSQETEDCPGAFAGYAIPVEGYADKRTHRLTINPAGGFTVSRGFGKAQILHSWDGKPKRYTAYG